MPNNITVQFNQKEENRVCLINPHTNVPPFGIMSIAALLEKNGIDVNILSFTEQNVSPDKILNKIRGAKVVGISTWSMPMITDAVRITKIIRQSRYEGFLIWGGGHPTLFPREVIKELNLDAVCIGEGEYTMLDLVQTLRNRGDISKVKGLYIQKDGDIIFTGVREKTVDVEGLPGYAWHLIDVERYIKRNIFSRKKAIVLVESRGCPYKCSFCYAPKMFGSKWRGRTVDQIVEEMGFLNTSFKIAHFDFSDDLLFGGNKQKILYFCSKVKPLGVTWSCLYRINLIDEQLLKEMKSSGLQNISFGIESGSQRILEKLRKTEVTPLRAKKGIDTCFRIGIKTNVGFISGVPSETKEDLQATLNLARELKATTIRITSYVPYPGTELYNEALKSGFKVPRNTEEWGRLGSFMRDERINTSRISSKELNVIKLKLGFYCLRNIFKFSLHHREFKFLHYYIIYEILYTLPDNVRKIIIKFLRVVCNTFYFT